MINISRKTRNEAEQAVADLVERGFEVKYPVTKKIVGECDVVYVAKLSR